MITPSEAASKILEMQHNIPIYRELMMRGIYNIIDNILHKHKQLEMYADDLYSWIASYRQYPEELYYAISRAIENKEKEHGEIIFLCDRNNTCYDKKYKISIDFLKLIKKEM